MVAALVISDALPVGPAGLPDTVEAAGPSKGTITFYRYKQFDSKADFGAAKGYNTNSVLLLNKVDGNWYYMNDLTHCANNAWIASSINADFRINPDVKEFYSRNKWSNIYLYKRQSDDYYQLCQRIDGTRYNVECDYYSPYLYIKSDETSFWRFNQGSQGTGWFDTWNLNNDDIWHALRQMTGYPGYAVSSSCGWGGSYVEWKIYEITPYYFTCINSNYTIGENQVYVADRDLFLREDVKLTIPDGSVLCVKNGPFYVNGEIECYGTILVEDGGIIMPYDSTSGGSRIVMKEGGAMIIRSGGRVYAGCPKGSLKTQGTSGWLDMYAGSSIINFGLLIAGQCNFKYGQATIENHKGGKMFLGYYVKNEDESHFMNSSRDANILASSISGSTDKSYYYGASYAGGGATVAYGKGTNQTVLKIWDGALTCLMNKSSDGGETVKKYYYDKDGKCTVDSNYKP